MVLDGRGSAPRSHLGAAAALAALRSALQDLEGDFSAVLDTPGQRLASIGWQGLARILYHRAAIEQLRLAASHKVGAAEFEFTLSLAVIGHRHIGWFSVGDSPLLILRHGISALLAKLEKVAFANQTTFVSPRPSSTSALRGGVIPASGVEGILAMSDGAASRFIDLRKQVPAAAAGELIAHFAASRWRSEDLRKMFHHPSWDGFTRDDRSLSLLARLPDRGASDSTFSPRQKSVQGLFCSPPPPAKPAQAAGRRGPQLLFPLPRDLSGEEQVKACLNPRPQLLFPPQNDSKSTAF